MSTVVSTLGFPRIGPRRDLKNALESYWAGKTSQLDLLRSAEALRAANWERQRSLGVTHLPSNDFSLYDHVLDTSVMVGATPALYGDGQEAPLETYFAMARGSTRAALPALDMTKWFDTNYHYLVPELAADQAFRLASTKPLDEYLEARALGLQTRPVLLGPVTYLLLAKTLPQEFDPLTLLDRLVPVYAELLARLAAAGAEWVQLDEPALVLDLDARARAAFASAYARLAQVRPAPRMLLTTYFGALGANLRTALELPVAGLHLDLVRAPQQLAEVLAASREDLVLSLGLVDGRNIWRSDLSTILDEVEPVVAAGRTIFVAPSCSLLHAPIDLDLERDLDPELRSWLAFAVQKVAELATLAKALDHGRASVAEELAASDRAVASRRSSPRTNDGAVRERLSRVTAAMLHRSEPFSQRREEQRRRLTLPAFPTTTIGSFPQTEAVRRARAAHSRGALGTDDYDAFLKEETASAIRWQEEVGLDVLVHGEFERNDMVQYFAEHLDGFAFTKQAWVQSYGSRCVRPPILFGDVARPKPITVEWWRYAQSLTSKPVKGMLTGPVTILKWSFVRDDQPLGETCRQIALALRDEVTDLEAAGARIIQIDEAALREGLPLRRADWQAYLTWAVECFRLTSCGVGTGTQIHTHMCYSEFNSILADIAAMDADVISIEAARSKIELLEALSTQAYPNEIGPGVYDIHSPRVPTVEEMAELLKSASRRLAPEQIWVNPDCGLKTRGWAEVRPALVNMVKAAEVLRAAI